MESDLIEFEICYFIKLSPKLLNSFEKSSGLLEIYLEHFKICLSLKVKSLLSLPNIITYIWLSMRKRKHDYHHHLRGDFYMTRHNAKRFTEMIAPNPHHFISKDLLNQQVFIEHLLHADTVLGPEMTIVNTIDASSYPPGAYILVGMKRIITK